MTGLLALLAYACLAAAMMGYTDAFNPWALAAVLAALVLTLAGTVLPAAPAADRAARPWVAGGLGLVVAVEWVGMFLLLGQSLIALPVVLLGVLPLLYVGPRRLVAVAGFPSILLVTGLTLGVVVFFQPKPGIDVWHFQQLASAKLLEGENPYSAEYPNVYGHTKFYGDKVLKDGKVQSFPYPPLSLALGIPGYLTPKSVLLPAAPDRPEISVGNDVRLSLWLAFLLNAVLMVAVARRAGLPAGHPAELTAVALLYFPLSHIVLFMAWTEPFLALFAALAAWAVVRNDPVLKPVALAGILAVKQYGLLLVPPLLFAGRVNRRDVLIGCALALLTAVPFLLWDWRGFVQGNIYFHVYNVFRPDAVSVLAYVYDVTGRELPGAIGLVAAGLVWLLAWWRRKPTLAHAMMAGSAVLLAFFVFNKGAFLNYYWVAMVTVLLTVVASMAEAGKVAATGRDGANAATG